MKNHKIVLLCFFVLLITGIVAIPLLCCAGDDREIQDSEDMTTRDLNNRYISGFKENLGKDNQVNKGYLGNDLGVDKKDLINSESNTKTDDEMSDQKKYTE